MDLALRVFSSVPSQNKLRGALHIASLFVGLVGAFPAAVRAQRPAAAGAAGYRLETRWHPGGDGGWGSLTFDSQTHRLYVARTDGVQVFDTERGMLVRTIPGLDGGCAVALAPELNRGFATSGHGGTVLVFDFTSLRSDGAPVRVGREPDAIVYERLTRHVFVFNAGSRNASVLDAATAAVVATIPLGGVPRSAVSDDQGVLLVNLEDKNEVLAIDSQKNIVAHRWPLAPGTEPVGLALDPIKHRVFAGCRDGRLIVLDARSGKHLAELTIGKGADTCAVDASTGLAFASCDDGTLAIVQEDPADSGEFRVVANVETQPGARKMALDPRTHAVYLAAASFESAPAVATNGNIPPAEMVPGSFVLLKFTR